FQLKHLFHTLKRSGSAGIEGNNTTIAEYIETRLEDKEEDVVSYSIREIMNIEKAMAFIEDTIDDYPINQAFVSELHKLIVEGLHDTPRGKDDRTPRQHGTHGIKIARSDHLPPEPSLVDGYMDDL